ncbi:MAG TPA: penicillin-binding protein 2 [Pyrinomonadaceae bacterium]|jgi:penicillin-binding protein 2|nr:penicillin-binding protein 2 [Pyrinomonadaceae bacterium]
MKFEDSSQNLRSRLWIVQSVVVLMLALLGIRLYYLQLVRGQYYAEIAQNQRIRLLPIPAPRGVIFDRDGHALVTSSPIYNVILSREDLRDRKLVSLVQPLAEALRVDGDLLRDRFEQIGSQPAFESILVKQDASPGDIAWVEAHELEFPELRVEQQPQRRYPANGLLAHVVGYVGEISPEQLKQINYKDKGLKPGDVIGLSGLEQTYDDYLRGKDGYRKVIVDSRGRIQDEIETIAPQPGQDLVTTIDLDLQMVAEEQLRTSSTGRGVIVALDPNNGEILALASAPTFDPNLFSRIGTKEGRAEYVAVLNDPQKPLINRAVQSRYPPGSTWKVPMAISGLEQGAITLDHSNLVCGGGIQVGNKFTRCMGNHGTPDLKAAITHSCDGYFYRLGLKMGLDGIMAMVDEFDLNKRTGIDLPNEVIDLTPSRELKKRTQPENSEWKDIDTVYASFGQVYDIITPIALLRTVAGVANGGKLYVPHLLKEVRSMDAAGPFEARAGRSFQPLDSTRPNPKLLSIPEDIHHLVVEGMWGVVNNGGTGAAIRMAGFDIAGKTGTAQVVGLGKDTGKNKDHSWFVSYAPAYKPEIALVALIENSGFGGQHAAPAVRRVYDAYYRKTRNAEPPGALPVAKTPKPDNKPEPKKPETAIARNQ